MISHHGKGRPLVPPVSDGAVTVVGSEVEGVPVEAPADLSIVDWTQPRRFRRLNERFGPWGLALLEAIVIRADHPCLPESQRREGGDDRDRVPGLARIVGGDYPLTTRIGEDL